MVFVLFWRGCVRVRRERRIRRHPKQGAPCDFQILRALLWVVLENRENRGRWLYTYDYFACWNWSIEWRNSLAQAVGGSFPPAIFGCSYFLRLSKIKKLRRLRLRTTWRILKNSKEFPNKIVPRQTTWHWALSPRLWRHDRVRISRGQLTPTNIPVWAVFLIVVFFEEQDEVPAFSGRWALNFQLDGFGT